MIGNFSNHKKFETFIRENKLNGECQLGTILGDFNVKIGHYNKNMIYIKT